MRRQLAVLVAATTTLVLLAFLVPLAVLLRTLAADRAVAQGVQDAQTVAVVVAVVGEPAQLLPVVEALDQRSARSVTVFLPDGRQVGEPVPAGNRARELAEAGRSFSTDVAGGREVYVAVDTTRGRAVVRVLVPDALLRRGVAAATALLAALGLALLGVTLLIADRLARGTVRPVTELAEAAHRLAAGDLTTRVSPAGPPEVVEVGEAVNTLGRRIGELLASERDAVADLSHRLRTPLTALRLDAEALRDPVEAQRLGDDVSALERSVDDVIRGARRPARGDTARCDAADVVRRRVAFWSVLAQEQGRPWQVDVDAGPHDVRLAGADLEAALDALLGNVFAHTPDDAAVQIAVSRTGGEVRIEVADRGPGLSAAALERGHSGAGSTGLGLDIVRRTAEAGGGRLDLAARPAGGASITLVLPPA